MQMVLKPMRDATMKAEEGSAGQDSFTSMLDAQFANSMAGRPGGLADMIARQLERHLAGELAGEQHLGERVLHVALDHPLQGPRAERRVVSLVRQVVARLVAKGLAGLSIMGDLGGINSEKADAKRGAIVGDGGYGVAVRDVLESVL